MKELKNEKERKSNQEISKEIKEEKEGKKLAEGMERRKEIMK